MKFRPILFSAPMVQAILAGHKTQTRRAITIPEIVRDESGADGTCIQWVQDHEAGPTWAAFLADYPEEGSVPIRCRYGAPGDGLWVREAFSFSREHSLDIPWYWADGNPEHGDWTRPKPSIHMPRWASRISLEVTAVRCERLQEISHDDACAEGIPSERGGKFACIARYRALWESINGEGSWDLNPWVWVVAFKRLA